VSEASSRALSWRAVAGALLFAALVLFGLKPFYARFLVADRQAWGTRLDAFPDRRAPGYVDLLREADPRIPAGSRVAIVFPTLDWPGGYSYAYFRAQYLLAGRVLIPLSWFDRPQPERIEEADFVVVYRAAPPRGRWQILFQNRNGAVARRER
jgi:hypothetical protein